MRRGSDTARIGHRRTPPIYAVPGFWLESKSYIFNMSDPAPARIRALHERAEDNDFEGMTPAQRVGMMWQLALDAWAFQGSGDAESRLPRHIVRIQRGTR